MGALSFSLTGGLTFAPRQGGGGAAPAPEWWQRAAQPALAAVDIGKGAGVGYTISAGKIGTMLDLTGKAALTPTTGMATIGTFGGLDAAVFDTGTAIKCYSGANSDLANLLLTNAGFISFSFHHASEITSYPATQRVITLSKSGSGSSPALSSPFASSGAHASTISSAGGGTDSLSAGAVRAYSVADKAFKSQFVNGADGKVTTFLNGEINSLSATTTIAGHPEPLGFNLFNVGGLPTVTGGATGPVGGAAVFGHASHTLAEASDIHTGMLERWAPELMRDTFVATGHGQSNMEAATPSYPAASNPVSFTDGTAYAWSTGSVLVKTGVGHAFFSNRPNPIVHFAKELATLTGWTPVISNFAAGGIGLVGGGLNGSAGYSEPTTAAGTSAGATSGYATNLAVRQVFDDLVTYTPRFNLKPRIMLWIGCETDVANLVTQKVAGVVPPATIAAHKLEVVRALHALFDANKADLGYTHFCLSLTGRRGTTLAEVQENEPLVQSVNDAYAQVVAERTDTYIIFTHMPEYNAGAFTQDDLVVDGDGAWVSGNATADGVHYTEPMLKAIGVSGARSFKIQAGL